MSKLATRYSLLATKKGVVLILTFIMMTCLTAITGAFLYMISIQTKGSGYDTASNKALWLAEAGIQKAIWYLKTPVGSGGKGDDWVQPAPGLTESLGSGSYTMVVQRWDFALEANGSTASASSTQGGNKASKAIDGNDTTYWESKKNEFFPEEIIITFPYPLTINKVRFYSSSSTQGPKDYTWQVSTDGNSWTTVVTVVDNALTDRTDEFSAQSNVNYLNLNVTKRLDDGNESVMVNTLETIGSKITSTGSLYSVNRKVEQTVVAEDGTGTAAHQKDWNEIVPAT